MGELFTSPADWEHAYEIVGPARAFLGMLAGADVQDAAVKVFCDEIVKRTYEADVEVPDSEDHLRVAVFIGVLKLAERGDLLDDEQVVRDLAEGTNLKFKRLTAGTALTLEKLKTAFGVTGGSYPAVYDKIVEKVTHYSLSPDGMQKMSKL